jgi:lipopolysaccharide/colanic/teichoic acid biosynthesis glycosyltransferase
MLTRVLDIIVALFGLTILILMLPVIGLLVKFDSKGPIFYKCDRVGKKGKIFKMYKFRTMYETPMPLGASVSHQGDPRVTPVGRLLRRSKLNEFPQFLNVLKGEMTLVGPRPESPDLAAAYPPEARPIFSVKPGLVGPNQIIGRNEEENYPQGVNPTKHYIEEILPVKLPLDLEYVRKKSFLQDLKYLFWGARVTITGAISRQHLRNNLSQFSLLVADSLCCLLTFFLAYLFRFNHVFPMADYTAFWKILPLTLLTRIPLLVYFGSYRSLIRYLGLSDLKHLFLGVSIGSAGLVLIIWLSGFSMGDYGRAVFFTDWLSLSFLLMGYRAILKSIQNNRKQAEKSEPRRALIWGVGDEGRWCLRYLRQSLNPSYEVVGFIDENPKMRHRRIDGLEVLGDHYQLEVLVPLHKIQEIFVAGPGIPDGQVDRVRELHKRLSVSLMQFVPRTIKQITPASGRVTMVTTSAR